MLCHMQMANVLTNGTGEFDRTYFVDELPKKLGIKERRVKQALESLAKERKRTTLVQAVSYLRQKKLDDAVKSLNNLLACHKVCIQQYLLDFRFPKLLTCYWGLKTVKHRRKIDTVKTVKIICCALPKLTKCSAQPLRHWGGENFRRHTKVSGLDICIVNSLFFHVLRTLGGQISWWVLNSLSKPFFRPVQDTCILLQFMIHLIVTVNCTP